MSDRVLQEDRILAERQNAVAGIRIIGAQEAPTVTSIRPVRKDVARNRAALLAAAEELISSRGLGVTLDEIAEHAGVGVATAYRHFSNKQAVMEVILQQRVEDIGRTLRALAEREDPVEALREFLVIFGERQQSDRGLRDIIGADHGMNIAEYRDQLIPLVEELVHRAHAAGRLHPDVTATDVPMVLWIIAAISEYSADIRSDLWRRYLDLLVAGMTRTDDPKPLPAPALDPVEMSEATRRSARRHR